MVACLNYVSKMSCKTNKKNEGCLTNLKVNLNFLLV